MHRVLSDAPLNASNGKRQGKRKVDFAKPAILAVAFLFIAGSASGQLRSGPSNYDVKDMGFDMWCQEAQKISRGSLPYAPTRGRQGVRGLPRGD